MKKSFGSKVLVFPTPVWVVGSYGKDGSPNIMTAAWAGVCCSKPPCVTVSLRKATLTYGNILDRQAFSVNVASEEQVTAVDYAGIASGKSTDKFADSGLTPTKCNQVDAPYVEEFPMILECKLLKTVEIDLHTLFIGEIMDVRVDEGVLGDNGLPDIEKVRPFVYSPEAGGYNGIGKFLGKAFSIGKNLKK